MALLKAAGVDLAEPATVGAIVAHLDALVSRLETELQGLDQQVSELEAQQQKLVDSEQKLRTKIEAFRTKKETIKATYTAAEAQTRINEALSGISEEMGDVGLAIQRAEDKTAQMQARASAVDELLASGVLDDVTGQRDDIQAELDRLGGGMDVELELQRMKAELGQAPAPREALEPGRPGQQAQQAPPPAQDEGPGIVEKVMANSVFRSFLRSAASAAGREINRGLFGTARRR